MNADFFFYLIFGPGMDVSSAPPLGTTCQSRLRRPIASNQSPAHSFSSKPFKHSIQSVTHTHSKSTTITKSQQQKEGAKNKIKKIIATHCFPNLHL